jgi:hypothetical protein
VMGAFRHLDAVPCFKPGVHHVDLGLLRGLDLLGEGSYRGIDVLLRSTMSLMSTACS